VNDLFVFDMIWAAVIAYATLPFWGGAIFFMISRRER